MPLIKIKEGSIADSNTLNANFDFLNKEIGENTFSKYSYDQVYSEGDFITVIENGFLTAFRSKQNENVGHPVADTNYWEKVNISSTGSFNMFDTKLSDRVLEGISALGWALQGTYVYKKAISGKRIGYPDFYNVCVKEKSEAIAHTVDLGGQSLVLYRHGNGHEFFDIKDKTIVDNWFNTFGIADWYGVDISSERIFLPRNRFYQQLTVTTDYLNTNHGSTMTEMELCEDHTHSSGTLDATGRFPADNWVNGDSSLYKGVFSLTSAEGHRGRASSSLVDPTFIKFNLKDSITGETSPSGKHNHKFKNTKTTNEVTPPSSYKFLYYCVGNTLQDIGSIDIVQQVEDGVIDIANAKNTALEEIEAKRTDLITISDNGIQSLIDQTSLSLTQISDTKDGIIQEIEQNTSHIIDDFNVNATAKTEEFNNNVTEKEALINSLTDNARIYASGTDEEVSNLTGIPGSKSSKGYMEEAQNIIVSGFIDDNTPSLKTTYSSTKIEELVEKGGGGVETLPIHVNPINPNDFYVDKKASEIRALVYEQSKDVRLSFYDTITNTGEQIYNFETFDKQNYAVFRRNVVTEDKIERINIKVGEDKKVTFVPIEYKGGGNGGLEIGDIAYTRFTVNEAENKRRILNGQTTLLTQFKVFKKKLDKLKATNPEQFVTNEQWEAEALLNVDGTCDKFVYDGGDTVRLPKYPTSITAFSDNLPVKGNGLTLGLINSSNQTGTLHIDGNGYMEGNTNGYGKPVSPESSNIAMKRPTSLGVTPDPTKSGLVVDGSSNTKLQVTYFIQVATGATEKDSVINEYQLNNPYSLLDCKYSDHKLSNVSWLLSSGQWNNGTIYVGAFDLLVKEYGTPTIEGLSVKKSDEVYTDYDFVINTTDKTFRLPIKTKLASGSAIKGTGKTLGLLSQGVNYGLRSSNTSIQAQKTGYDYPTQDDLPYNDVLLGTGGAIGVTKDGSKSGIVTDEKDLYLYYYVGETIQNANLINVSDIKATKADIDLGNSTVPHIIDTYENGTDGYNVYSNGYCEQWGWVDSTKGRIQTVTLLKRYKDTNYNIILGSGNRKNNPGADSWSSDSWGLGPINEYQMNAAGSDTSSGRMSYWHTYGYLAKGEY